MSHNAYILSVAEVAQLEGIVMVYRGVKSSDVLKRLIPGCQPSILPLKLITLIGGQLHLLS